MRKMQDFSFKLRGKFLETDNFIFIPQIPMSFQGPW